MNRRISIDEATLREWIRNASSLEANFAPFPAHFYDEVIETALSVSAIARIAHEVNRAYCISLGDWSQYPWDSAPEWQRASCEAGVRAHLQQDRTPAESHERWLEHKRREGWKWGPQKDEQKKEHPCFVSFAELPKEQQLKDALFSAVVSAAKRVRL